MKICVEVDLFVNKNNEVIATGFTRIPENVIDLIECITVQGNRIFLPEAADCKLISDLSIITDEKTNKKCARLMFVGPKGLTDQGIQQMLAIEVATLLNSFIQTIMSFHEMNSKIKQTKTLSKIMFGDFAIKADD